MTQYLIWLVLYAIGVTGVAGFALGRLGRKVR